MKYSAGKIKPGGYISNQLVNIPCDLPLPTFQPVKLITGKSKDVSRLPVHVNPLHNGIYDGKEVKQEVKSTYVPCKPIKHWHTCKHK